MPFNELQRRDSWPPTIIHLRDGNADIEAIDENPFSYFLTSPDEITDDDIDDLSAGIESDDDINPDTEVREISPSSLQRAPLAEDDESFGFAMPLSLKDFTQSHRNGRESRAAHRTGEQLKGLGIVMPKFSGTRGRATVRLAPPRGRGRGQTRSLPLRRPHSWREPSPVLGSIKEERESDDGDEWKEKMPSTQKECKSAPASALVSSKAVASPKLKKKVHWAE